MTKLDDYDSRSLADWAEPLAALDHSFPRVLRAESPRFMDYAWRRFDADVVAGLILSGPNYVGQKKVLVAGLCAWTLRPNRQALVRNAMLHAAWQTLIEAEDRSRHLFERNVFLREIASRVIFPGRDFMEDIYYAVGGMKSVSKAASPKQLANALRASYYSRIDPIVQMMTIIHFHSIMLSDRSKYRQPSIDRVAELLSSILFLRKRRRSARNIRVGAQGNYASAAYIYAAHLMPVSESETVLSRIKSHVFQLDDETVEAWLGRVAMISRSMLAPMRASALRRVVTFSAVSEPSVMPPSFSDDEMELISKGFVRSWRGRRKLP